MKSTVVIAIVVAIAVMIAVGVGLWVRLKNSVVDGPDMENKNRIIECSYNCGGGENGGYYYVSLVLSYDKTSAKLSVSKRETWQTPESTQEYTVPVSAFLEIEKVVEKYHLKELNVDELTEYELLDGDTETIAISFENGERIRLGCVELPEEAQGAYKALLDCMLSFAAK